MADNNDALRVQDAISDAWMETYKLQREKVGDQLLIFNTRLFTLEKLEGFPFSLFLPFPPNRIFWHTIRDALIEATIIVAWRIIVDTDGDMLTLRGFKNEIMKHARSDDAKKRLGDLIKQVDFENQISASAEKVRHVRHNYLAHFIKETQLEADPSKIALFSLNLQDMKNIFAVSQKLFYVLCLTERYSLDLADYSESRRQKRDTDIDRLLDKIAKESIVLNLPEKNPIEWKTRRAELSSAEIAIVNDYRKRFGLPDA